MFVDIQRQSAMDIDENISPNVAQISTPTNPSLPLQACSSVSQPHAQPQQVQDPHVVTQRPKALIMNISQSSSEQDSQAVQLNVETPSLIVNNYFSSSDVEKDYVANTPPIPIEHCEDCKLSPEEKKLPVKEKHIFKICYELKSWKKTAREGFGLTEAQVCQLENDFKMYGDNEYAFQSYRKSKMEKGHTHTYVLWEMVEILHRSQEHEAVKLLKHLVIEAEDTNLSVVESSS